MLTFRQRIVNLSDARFEQDADPHRWAPLPDSPTSAVAGKSFIG
jgi:hypothetical protein